jgi:hypothetical protein
VKSNEHLRDALAQANRERAEQRQTTAWRDARFRELASATPAWYHVEWPILVSQLVEALSS